MVLGGGLGLVLFGSISNLLGGRCVCVLSPRRISVIVLFFVLDNGDYSRSVPLYFYLYSAS